MAGISTGVSLLSASRGGTLRNNLVFWMDGSNTTDNIYGNTPYTSNNTSTQSSSPLSVVTGQYILTSAGSFRYDTTPPIQGVTFGTTTTFCIWSKISSSNFTNGNSAWPIQLSDATKAHFLGVECSQISSSVYQARVGSSGGNVGYSSHNFSLGQWYLHVVKESASGVFWDCYDTSGNQAAGQFLLPSYLPSGYLPRIWVGDCEYYSPSSGMTIASDSIGVWSRTLTNPEITTLINGGSGLAYADL